MKQILCCLILIALAASAFSATPKMIPELNKLNNGLFTSDYSVTYNSPVQSGEFGVSSEAGDINNDGVPDFMIGDPGNDNKKGIVYVIYGKRGTLRQFNNMNDFQPSDGFIIKGSVNGQKLGYSLSAVGDVNGDGISDIIIGSPFWNRDGYVTEAGIAYVLFGRRSSSEFPSVVDVDRLSFSQGFKLFGLGTGYRAGWSVSGGVDVNGDGVSDIIIGAIGAAAGGNAYVVYGSKQGLTDMTLPVAAGKGFAIQGLSQENFGSSVSKIGDFNGDGVDDIIIGAHAANNYAGKAYIIYGRRGGFPSSILATDGMTLEGMYSYDQFGCMVSNAGDFNGDGLQDVIIGAYGANARRGGAYVIMGSRTNPSVLNMKATDAAVVGFNLMSSAYSQMSMSVSGGRDINGDGKSDIIIGAPSYNKESGGVYVIYGSSKLNGFWLDTPLTPQQGFSMFGTQEGSRYGQFVRMLSDINADGLADFIVGASTANGGKGAANLFYLPWTCPAQCISCMKPNTCDSWVCPDKCKKCSSGPNICDAWICPDRCARCSSAYTCDAWICPDKCSKCSSASTCDAWICPENCSQCSKADVCDTCKPGYGIIDDRCSYCSSDTHFINNGFCIEMRSSWDLFKDFLSKLF